MPFNIGTIIAIICIILIGVALFIFIRNLKRIGSGKCCESCKGCSHQSECSNIAHDDKKNH